MLSSLGFLSLAAAIPLGETHGHVVGIAVLVGVMLAIGFPLDRYYEERYSSLESESRAARLTSDST